MTKITVHRVASWRNEIHRVAIELFGPPNLQLSNEKEIRFGRKGSKRVDPTTGYYQDFQSGEFGYLVKRAHQSKHVVGKTISDRSDNFASPSNQKNERKTFLAKRVFKEAVSIDGTLAEKYLKTHRGINLSRWPATLRFAKNCPRGETAAPALVAEMRCIFSDGPTAIQRIFLNAEDCRRDGPRMMLGPSKQVACKLSHESEVSLGLGIAEGIETALSILSLGWVPVWAVMSAGGIERFPILGGLESLTIFADNDRAGLSAARRCAKRWAIAGAEARIMIPTGDGRDWNDATKESR